MSEAPLFAATRDADTARRLMRNVAVSGLSLAVILYLAARHGFDTLNMIVIAIVLPILALQVQSLRRSRQPLTLYVDRVEICVLMRSVIARADLRGLIADPRTGAPAFDYENTEHGHAGALRLPWRYIAETREEVLAQIKTHYGFEMKEAAA